MHDRSPDELLREVSWLRRLAQRLVADPGVADDLAGDTLAAWSAARTPPDNPRGWLATVLRHFAEHHHRRAERRRRAEAIAAAPRVARPVDESLATAELHKNLVDAVLALDEAYRTPIVLRFLDELPLREVARRLGVPVETARTRIRRGLDRLRSRLDERHGGRAAWVVLCASRTPPLVVPFLGAMMVSKIVCGAAAAALIVWLFLDDGASVAPDAAANATAPERPATVPESKSPESLDAAANVRSAAAVAKEPGAVFLLRGRVVDEATGVPVADVTVTGVAAHDATDAVATTGADGTFSLPFAAATDEGAAVLLTHTAYAPLTMELRGANVDTAARTSDCGDIELAPGTQVVGVVLDTTGNPVAAADIFMCISYWTNGGRRTRLDDATHVGVGSADGTFRLDRRLLPNRPPAVLIAVSGRGMGFFELADLSRKAHECRIEVRLSPSVPVSVTVVDENGAAIHGARVTAEPKFPPIGTLDVALVFARRSALEDAFVARSDATGHALLQLPIGTPAFFVGTPVVHTAYRVRGQTPDHDGAVASFDFVEPPSTPTQLRLVLSRQQRIEVSGRVRSRDGQPIANATVAGKRGGDAAVRTDASGSYTMTVGRGDGTLVVVASAPGCFPRTQESPPIAAAATSATIDFVLDAAAELIGRVVDQAGDAVAGASVRVEENTVETGEDGSFRTTVWPDRAMSIQVEPPSAGIGWNGPVEHVVLGGQRAVTITLTRLPGRRSSLDARLLDANGAPLDGQTVQLRRDDDGQQLDHPATLTIGRVTAGDLVPGDWSLRIVARQGCALACSFTVRGDGAPIEISLRQQHAITVHGDIVFEPAAAALARLELAFSPAGQPARFAVGTGQRSNHDRTILTLDAGAARAFYVYDVDPSRPLVVVASADGFTGEGTLRPEERSNGRLRVVVRPAARVRVLADEAFQGTMLLQLRRSGGEWEEPVRYWGRAGRVELLTFQVPGGSYEWRARSPSRGAGNATAARWQAGTLTVEPGGTTDIDLR